MYKVRGETMSWPEYRDSGAWLQEATPYFRALGFYPNEQHLSDAEHGAGAERHFVASEVEALRVPGPGGDLNA